MKKKMGRPKKKISDCFVRQINVRMTTAELKIIDNERMKAGGISRSAMLMKPWRSQKDD
ncbi:MAG: hypothetical protein WAX69_12265 [Victivallales bacterium]